MYVQYLYLYLYLSSCTYRAGILAAKPFGAEHLTVARRRPVRPLRGEADELAIARVTMYLVFRDLVGFVIYVVEQHEAASAQCARPAGWRQWLEWPLAGVVGRPPPKRRLQCYYDIYWRHDRAKNEVVRASWGPVHHMATA